MLSSILTYDYGRETMGKRQGQEQVENPSEQNNEHINQQNPKGVILLGVYIHCEGCANSVVKCLRGFDGVEVIEIDAKNHKVTVKGKKADPLKVAERAKVIEVLLKIYMHCEGCAKEIKYCIHKMQGVQTVEPDMAKSQVKVRGVFEPQKLVEYINKRAGKYAVILKQTTEKKEQEEGKGEKEEKKWDPNHDYPSELVYAPQLFSDENPNSCSVM
ncbi:hypothetical protein F0562_033126 [Nyssa sinensis]|uniref:HMA domain-containing protein n=1 Tax=Nyssa sinensis TaxID=561372 RepID=A0A5J5AWF5_9ASTE|nr:hypothetical protein F0562_033126 [Nyssa sinensis]